MPMLRPALIAFAIAIAAAPAMAQVPRARDGKPDLTGIWSHASVTPLQRAPANKTLVVSEEEAKRIVDGHSVGGYTVNELYNSSAYSDPKAGPPPKGGKDSLVQAYDFFWRDPGNKLAFVRGEYRTSYIVEPANGQLPLKDPKGDAERRRLDRELREQYNSDSGGVAYEGPEVPNLGERCLIGLGNTGGPGMLTGSYNNNYRFVQTADYVMILVEMVHEAHIAPIFATAAEARAHHKPSAIKPWFGDSVGWWEGDTFVMETINVYPEQQQNHGFTISPKAVITERFTRASEKDVVYEFTVDDPDTYTQPWKAELSFYPSKGMYEYACHEGNYGMTGILAGAREKERRWAAESAKAKTKNIKGGQ